MDKAASIIILHGPSSSGKSTLARALQARIELPFWHVSIDHIRDSGMLPMARYKTGDFVWREHRAAVFDGFHRSLRAYAEAGVDYISIGALTHSPKAADVGLEVGGGDEAFGVG